MSSLKSPGIMINKPDKAQKDTSNYYWLREAGMKHVEELSSKIWTDYNSHDPGVTILEVLCYALTDLGYRTKFPLLDLITEKEGNREAMHAQFFTALQVLPSRPVTVNDYRKILIDIEGVNNAWLKAVSSEVPVFFNKKTKTLTTKKPESDPYEDIDITGIYKVIIEFNENVEEGEKAAILDEVKKRLHANRNLCEDFGTLETIKKQDFILCGEIRITPQAVVEKVEAEIFFRVQQYLAPGVRHYTLKEMLARGKAVEEIFEGTCYKDPETPLDHGFIDDDELEASALKTEIRLSDIISIIMDIDGVLAVNDLVIQPDVDKLPEKWNKWHVPVLSEHQPDLKIEGSRMVYYKDLLPFRADSTKMEAELQLMQDAVTLDESSKKTDDIVLPEGEYVDPAQYTSIAHEFPMNYGISRYGLPERSPAERKAKARQMKGYLLFYDQLLANYFAQLAHIKELFSRDETVKKTYFSQVVPDMPGAEDLYQDFSTLQDDLAALDEDKATFHERRNRFLDHLLARFNESFNEYVLLMYSLSGDPATNDDLIFDKAKFIQDYPVLSANRSAGFNYMLKDELWDTDNVTGLERRVARLTGIPNFMRRNLAKVLYEIYEEKDEDNITEYRFRIIDTTRDKILISSSKHYLDKDEAIAEMRLWTRYCFDEKYYEKKQAKDGRYYFNLTDDSGEVISRRIQYWATEDERDEAIRYIRRFMREAYSGEGMFVIEHLLLRPLEISHPLIKVCPDDTDPDCDDRDPYSFRISVILPAWEKRFADMHFRRFFEKTLRLETPAHIYPRICWVNEVHMSLLEDKYQAWLNARVKYPGNANAYKKALKELLEALNEVKTVYPVGTLRECNDSESENPIVLGSTSLGTFDANKEKKK